MLGAFAMAIVKLFALTSQKSNLRIHRVPSADWQTEDLDQLWSRTTTELLETREVSVHAFLDYCRVLQELRDWFLQQDSKQGFEKIFFFLRGGFFAYSYLNKIALLLDRAVIFGGLSHALGPEERFKEYLRSMLDVALKNGRTTIRILVVDEVKSGSGMGWILKAIRSVFDDPKQKVAVRCDLTLCAIRPDTAMSPELQKAVRSWTRESNSESTVSVSVKHLAGTLLGYDDDILCGIRRSSLGDAGEESYDMVKHSEGVVNFVCQENDIGIAIIGLIRRTCLVETLAYTAFSLTEGKRNSLNRYIRSGIKIRGCETCKARLQPIGPNGK